MTRLEVARTLYANAAKRLEGTDEDEREACETYYAICQRMYVKEMVRAIADKKAAAEET